MGDGSHGLGRNQRGLRVGCWAMVGDYNDDSSIQGELEYLVIIDSGRGNCRLERSRAKVLEEHLQENKDVRDFRDNSWQ